MNHTSIEWARNPDGTPGYTWNPITGCLNNCSYCYARKLANTRLKERYLANTNVADISNRLRDANSPLWDRVATDPFYPRFWEERLLEPVKGYTRTDWGGGNAAASDKGIFTCDMSDLFGIGIPEEWTKKVLEVIDRCYYHRFYLLTKQPQNLIKFGPFPDNCFVGVSVCNDKMLDLAEDKLEDIQAKVKFLSIEPLQERLTLSLDYALYYSGVSWVVIGAQSPRSDKTFPKWEWVKEIVEAADKAGIPVFLKENLGLPKYRWEGGIPFYKRYPGGAMELRQELPL